MNKENSNFRFIVIEGIDRSGKTTLTNRLATVLEHSVDFHFPVRDNHTGPLINKYLKKEIDLPEEAIHLMFVANRYEESSNLINILKSKNVICDRYINSGTSMAMARGKQSYEWITVPEKYLLKPDLTVFIDLSPADAARRLRPGIERGDEIQIQEAAYRFMRDECIRSGPHIIIDGLLTTDKMCEIIISKLEEMDMQ